MKRITFILVAMFWTLPSLGFAQVAPTGSPVIEPVDVDTNDKRSEEERIRFLLSGYEYFPSKQDLLKVGDGARVQSILIALVKNVSKRPSLRLRAVDALGYFKGDKVDTFLKTTIASTVKGKDGVQNRTQKRIRSHAITSFAKSAQKDGLKFLTKLAIHSDLDIRLSAIYGIGKHCGKEGRVVLSTLAKKEENSTVLRALRKFKAN